MPSESLQMLLVLVSTDAVPASTAARLQAGDLKISHPLTHTWPSAGFISLWEHRPFHTLYLLQQNYIVCNCLRRYYRGICRESIFLVSSEMICSKVLTSVSHCASSESADTRLSDLCWNASLVWNNVQNQSLLTSDKELS